VDGSEDEVNKIFSTDDSAESFTLDKSVEMAKKDEEEFSEQYKIYRNPSNNSDYLSLAQKECKMTLTVENKAVNYKDSPIHYNTCLAGIHLVQDDFSKAEIACRMAQKKYKGIYYSCMSDFYLVQGDINQAKSLCSLSRLSNKLAYYTCMSGIYIAEGDTYKAEQMCKSAMFPEYNDLVSYTTCMSGIHIAKGNIDDAKDACRLALTKDDKLAFFACRAGVYIGMYMDKEIRAMENEIQELRSQLTSNGSDNRVEIKRHKEILAKKEAALEKQDQKVKKLSEEINQEAKKDDELEKELLSFIGN